MPLSPQERRCIDLTIPVLERVYGGKWRFDHSLDDINNSEASPECILKNGELDAAIEVKRLTGDLMFQAYLEAQQSLERYLVPSCGGYYMLSPAVDLRLPIDGRLRRHLKKEIERVAPALEAGGGPGVLLMPREALISLRSPDGPGYISCCHNSSSVVHEITPFITGTFMLVDQGQLEHNFLTVDGRRRFQAALIEACHLRVSEGQTTFKWDEEWELRRSKDFEDDDPRDKNGVYVVACTDARHVGESVAEALDIVLQKATGKFRRRWASKHIIALDRADVLSNAERVREAFSWMDKNELGNLDLILLADGDDATIIWQHPGE